MESPPVFIETFAVLNGQVKRLSYHMERVLRTAIYFGFQPPSVDAFLLEMVDVPSFGVYRVTVLYGAKGIQGHRYKSYQLPLIEKLKPVVISENIYPYKFEDRSLFNGIKIDLEDKVEPILIKDGCITDTTFSNLVFESESGFFTPDTPLLLGTQRSYLLDKGIVQEKRVMYDAVLEYRKVHFINALLALGDLVLDVSEDLFIANSPS